MCQPLAYTLLAAVLEPRYSADPACAVLTCAVVTVAFAEGVPDILTA